MISKVIDLRSDTVTKPGQAMREAIANAEVGDDVFAEDATAKHLQERVAALLGKETGLFVPSGTMGNQVSIKSHTKPGDEVICEKESHCFHYEGGGPALLSGVQIRLLSGKRGTITVEEIKPALRPGNHHFPHSRLIVLENTHNRAGGAIFSLETMANIYDFAKSNGLAVHLDGARLWNAHIATGIPLSDYGKYVDSASLCFSKGLGAPVGSVVVGSRDFIDRAHRFRKIFGGGMRQIGILAAACLFALDHNLQRLKEDHDNAHELAEFLTSRQGINVDLEATQTNIVIAHFEKVPAAEFAERCMKKNLLCIPFSAQSVRFVTHLDVSRSDIQEAMNIIESIITARSQV
jgi:threonine aldolase